MFAIILFSCIFLHNGVSSAAQIDSNLLPRTEECGTLSETGLRASIAGIIFGGNEADLGELPWIVLLKANDGEFECGGALINSRYVMTAAHCLDDPEHPIVSVRLGEHNVVTHPDCDRNIDSICADDPTNVDVEETIIHESYIPGDRNMHADIGLLRLKEEVVYTNFIKPICLPTLNELQGLTLEKLSPVLVAGWGKTERRWRSDELRKVSLPVMPHKDCIQTYEKNGFKIVETQICAGGEKGKDSCQGDSGGPLMYYHKTNKRSFWISIGIVSYGAGDDCGSIGIPGIYTRVEKYIPWIIENVRS